MKEVFSITVVLLTLWAHYPFTWHNKSYISYDDDSTNYIENPHWQEMTAENVHWAMHSLVISCWEPMAWIAKMAACDFAAALYGEDSVVYGGPADCSNQEFGANVLHRSALLTHAFNAYLAYRLALEASRATQQHFKGATSSAAGKASRSTGNDWLSRLAALLAALWWGVQPQRAEVTAWASAQPYSTASTLAALAVLVAWPVAVSSANGCSGNGGAVASANMLPAMSIGQLVASAALHAAACLAKVSHITAAPATLAALHVALTLRGPALQGSTSTLGIASLSSGSNSGVRGSVGARLAAALPATSSRALTLLGAYGSGSFLALYGKLWLEMSQSADDGKYGWSSSAEGSVALPPMSLVGRFVLNPAFAVGRALRHAVCPGYYLAGEPPWVLHSEFVTVSSNSAVQLGLVVLAAAALGLLSAACLLWQHRENQPQLEVLEQQLVGGSFVSDSNNGNGKSNRSRKQRPNKQEDTPLTDATSYSSQAWVPVLAVVGQLLWVALCGWLAVLAPTLRPVGLHATTTAADRYTYAPAMLVGCPAVAALLRGVFALLIRACADISGSRHSEATNSSNGSSGPPLGPSLVLAAVAIAVGVTMLPTTKREQKHSTRKSKPRGSMNASPASPMASMLPEFAIDSSPLAEYFAMRGPVALLRQRGHEWANDGTKLIAMGGECAGLHGRRRLLPGYGRDLRCSQYVGALALLGRHADVASLATALGFGSQSAIQSRLQGKESQASKGACDRTWTLGFNVAMSHLLHGQKLKALQVLEAIWDLCHAFVPDLRVHFPPKLNELRAWRRKQRKEEGSLPDGDDFFEPPIITAPRHSEFVNKMDKNGKSGSKSSSTRSSRGSSSSNSGSSSGSGTARGTRDTSARTTKRKADSVISAPNAISNWKLAKEKLQKLSPRGDADPLLLFETSKMANTDGVKVDVPIRVRLRHLQVNERAGTVAIDPNFVPALCDRHRLTPAICAALQSRFSNALKTYFESSNGGEVPQAPYRGKAAHHLHIGDQIAVDTRAEWMAEQAERKNNDQDGIFDFDDEDDDDDAFDETACSEIRLQFAFAMSLNGAMRRDPGLAQGMAERLASAKCPPRQGSSGELEMEEDGLDNGDDAFIDDGYDDRDDDE